MNTDQLHELILAYLDDNLDPKNLDALISELASLGYDLNNLDELQTLVKRMDQIEIPEPSKKMDDRFYQMLESEINVNGEKALGQNIAKWVNSVLSSAWMPKLSYGLIMLLIGWTLGFWITPNTNVNNQMSRMNEEMQQMKSMVMLTMLNQPMASDRLKAVGMIVSSSSINDSQIIESLLSALNTDKDANVRLVAAEALLALANNKNVRDGLIYSVKDQPSPMIQITLIDGLVAMNVRDAVPEFRDLIQDGGLNSVVVEKLNKGIGKLI